MNKEYRKILQGATDQLENMKTALAAEFIGTSPRSSISRLRFQANKPPGPGRDAGDRGAPGIAPGSSAPLNRRAGLPKTQFDRPGQTWAVKSRASQNPCHKRITS